MSTKTINLSWQFLVEFMHECGYVYERHSNWEEFYINIVHLSKSEYFKFLINIAIEKQADQTHINFEII